MLTLRLRFSGTQTGTLQGIPPAECRSFSVPCITILRFGAHRCVERWSVADFLGMMTQIGAASPVSSVIRDIQMRLETPGAPVTRARLP